MFAQTPRHASPPKSDRGGPSRADHAATPPGSAHGLDRFLSFAGDSRNARNTLPVSTPGDRPEREADRLAEHVLRQPDRPRATAPLTATSQPPAGDFPRLGAGRPLPRAERDFFEPRFGHDFSRLRIHADAEAARSARALDAHAFTIGRDIVFGAGRYAPHTSAGRRLLAHELAHVAQPATPAPLIRRQKATDSDQPTDALQKAGKTTRRTVDKEAGDLMDAVLGQSHILRPYLGGKNKKIGGGKFIIMDSDPEFDDKYRKLNNIQPGSKEWNETGSVHGFYDRPSDTIYLRPRSNYGEALHESIHKFSLPSFRDIFGGFLDEGVTQEITDRVLQDEQKLEKGRTLYEPNLKCARKLIDDVASFDVVAKFYFGKDASLLNQLTARYHITLQQLQKMRGNSDEWCKLFGAGAD